MIGLYLLAAHLVGDFVLQTRWQAAGKLADSSLRMRHVWAYAVPFMPIVAWRTWGDAAWSSWHTQRGVVFVSLLVLLHFLTDSRRFRSTLGDVVAWRFGGRASASAERRLALAHVHDPAVGFDAATEQRVTALAGAPEPGGFPPPNPWTPIPILIDQTLHMAQLAVLGALFL